MVAAWVPPGSSKPGIIPAEAFHSERIVHTVPGRPQHVSRGLLPDFTMEYLGEVPLADIDPPMIRIQFKERHAAVGKGKIHWDFGDGQTSEEAEPIHVYLHPGLFPVRLGPASRESINQVQVHRGKIFSHATKSQDNLNDYVPLLSKYNPNQLDPLSALQLMRFSDQVKQQDRAVKIGKTRLLSDAPPEDESVVYAMAELIGPLLRDRFDDAGSAFAVWQAASKAVQRPIWQTTCDVEAAEIGLHELHRREVVKPLLQAATARLAKFDNAMLASRVHRLWGDWHARGGDKKAAVLAYQKAQAVQPHRPTKEREARRGAYGRTTEALLREKALDRAAEELRRWQNEFPEDNVDGYLSLQLARHHRARAKYLHAIVVANDLLTLNKDSPYADQLVFLSAECEEKRDRPDRAVAIYQSMLTDYPGSPMVAEAQKRLTKLRKATTEK